MKNALFIHLAFILPDNFEGSFEDALDLYLKFRRAQGYPVREAESAPELSTSVKMFRDECQQSLCDELIEAEKEHHCAVLSYSLVEFDEDAQEWKHKKGS